MKPLSSSPAAPPQSVHHFDELLGVTLPPPALERGLLHSRELSFAWHIDRIAEKLGDQCWFSHYYRDHRDPGPDNTKMRAYAIAGFWPSGGFIELRLHGANPLDDHPRGLLVVYAESAPRAEALMAEFLAHYRHDTAAAAPEARIGMLNYSCDSLTVERIPVTAAQIVPRAQVDLYYGTGATAWVDTWIATLNARRYGLTVLTGAPGTGKTTLLRSLAQWLAATHIFYFMPAARFTSVESGEIVTFWAGENRNSRLRKILILEDAESVLLRRGNDNREKVATLLNLTDGMLGDALGLHVVCTLNSDLGDLDPALLRPGRLVAHRDFDLLDNEEARRLAQALNLPAPVGDRVSLAEVFNPDPFGPAASRSSARRAMGFHTAPPRT
ncbi:MAG TPA: AAA family ATPase [Opitutaceae bacterium]|nr:AAA family ATPase [Lacunisphaera sp.]HWA09108.1 AAA family ATPase [Opitutaceae bacterium]